MNRTVKSQIDATGGRSSGFDYARIILSILVLCVHSNITSYGDIHDDMIWQSPLKPFARLLLPMFFALSGFLVAGSLERSRTLVSFLGLRIIRIYPALAVESLISAVVLGAILTDLPIRKYYTDPQFFSYMYNIIGDPHYYLPGVFTRNPDPLIVNRQLWTVPYELLCYVVLAGLTLFGIRRRRIMAPIGAAVVIGLFVSAKLIAHHGMFPQFNTPLPGPMLVAAFLCGVAVHLYRDRLTYSVRWFAVTTLASVALLGFVPFGEYIAPFPVSYVTVYLGLLNPKRLGVLKTADYSYGVFLYGYAIQQAVCGSFVWARHWYVNIIVCLPLAMGVAALSWILVERPALGLRVQVQRLEHWVLRRFPAAQSRAPSP